MVILMLIVASTALALGYNLIITGKINTTGYLTFIRFVTFGGCAVGYLILPYNLRMHGFASNRLTWRYNVKYGLLVGISIFCIVYFGKKYVMTGTVIPLDAVFNSTVYGYISYALFSIAQEIMSKGILQTVCVSLWIDKTKYYKFISILIASLWFSQCHIVFGVEVYIVTMIYGLATGYFYEKTRNITGVSIIHVCAGVGLFLS
jgi:hypothetical protein